MIKYQLVLGFLIFSSGALAQQSVEKMRELIEEVRSPVVNISIKEKVAQKTLEFLRSEFKDEFKKKDSKALFQEVLSRPDEFEKLVSNGKYKDLYTDFSRLISQIRAEKSLQNCGNYKLLKDSIQEGLSNYSPCLEGGFSHSYVLWQSKKLGEVTPAVYSIPNFIYSDNLNDLLEVAKSTTIELSQEADPPLVADGQRIRGENPKKSKNQNLSTYAKMQLQDDVYKRSILNAARNMVSLHVQYGRSPMGKEEISKNISESLKLICAHCSEKTKTSLSSRLNYVINNDLKSGKLIHRPASQVAKNICNKLKQYGYPFQQNYTIHESTSLVSQAIGKAKAKGNIYHEERMAALTQVAQEGGDGLLVLTDSLTNLDDKIPERLRLKCNGSASDNAIIQKAKDEASAKAAQYAVKINEKLNLDPTEDAVNQNIKFMMKSNPRGFGEALNKNPSLVPYACWAMDDIKREDHIDAMEDSLIIWGSAVAGTALTLTGVLAPVGTALTMGAVALGISVNLGSGVYELYSAEDAREKAELMHEATFASQDTRLMVISQEEYARYKAAKLSAMINFGFSAVDVSIAMKSILKTGRTVAEATTALEAANSKTLKDLVAQKGDEVIEKVIIDGNVSAEVKEVADHLQTVRGHMTGTDYKATGQFQINGKRVALEDPSPEAKKLADFGFEKGTGITGIKSKNGIRLEPSSPNANVADQIEIVILKDKDGHYLGKIPCVRDASGCLKGLNGQDIFDLPLDGEYQVFLKKKNGSEISLTPSKIQSDSDIPQGFRFSLSQKDYIDKGFYGGHTPDSFNQYLSLYKDRVKVIESKTKDITVKIPGTSGEFKVRQIYTSIDGQPAKYPKTIFVGGEDEIKAFEKALAPKLVGRFTKDDMIKEEILTSTGEKILVKIPFRGGKARTIYLEPQLP